jgi:hypothetical protein
VPITENFSLSNTNAWVISSDYYPAGGTRQLRVIDLTKQIAYVWTEFTDHCSVSDPVSCNEFSDEETDSSSYSDDTNLISLDSEAGDAELTIDMSQAVFDDTAATFTAPHAYNDLPDVGVDMSGILGSSVNHWGYLVAEFGDAFVGVEGLPTTGGTGGSITIPDPTPIYLDLSALSNHAPCTSSPIGGRDPHAQGYTLTAAGIPMGMFVSGDSRCVAIVDLGLLYAAPRQAGSLSYLVDTTSYDPVTAGAITFFAIPAE